MNRTALLNNVRVHHLLCVALFLLPASGAWAAGTYKIIHKFHVTDGETPRSGVIFDSAGNLYGTVRDVHNGTHQGIVYEVMPQNDGTLEVPDNPSLHRRQ